MARACQLTLQPSVVGDVLAKSHLAIDFETLHLHVVVLLNIALGFLGEAENE